MCGRTSLFAPRAELESRFDARVPDDYRPRYNVAPSDPLEVITADQPDVVQRFDWGFMPRWADADDQGFINARAETAHEKPAFSDAWESRPCLVLSSGFYEWKETGRGRKQPYRVSREDDLAFAMAGLWQRWEDDGDRRQTVTILTTDPNELVEPLHDRMAVVLPREAETTWLTAGPDERADLCRPYPNDDLDAYPISTAVNDPSNDSPAIVEPDRSEQTGLGEFGS
ncbi:SOS response-associated peptidase [Halorientalis brevis]|uniref:SOS response-associated peptidase n=1 Tax=Halorientalis brevis TaxID=1126241 RepID=A0ABD6CGZ6_9EURY|nr:SOS response-associated peptidase [Halorientalis brevis]